MSVSTIRAIALLFFLTQFCLADLPSCSRAKCVHCAVDFIARMCPTACSGCSASVVDPQIRSPQPPQVYSNQQQQQQFAQSVNSRQVSNEGGIAAQQQRAQPSVTVQQPTLNIPLQPHAQPVQFAAPVYQGQQQVIPYPSTQPPAPAPQVQTATLAPLVEPPRVATFDPNLSRQPADLAQPLPEYQNAQIAQPQQPYGLPQQPQLGYGTQMENIFNQPNPFAVQPQQQQPLFGVAQPQAAAQPQQTALLNPFQPFLQQANGNAFDPFNLFGNLNNPNQLNVNQQGISTVQAQQYGQVQHQGTYSPYQQTQQTIQPTQPQYQQQQQQQYGQQPQQQQQYQQQQQQQQQQYQQYQQQYNQQYSHQQPQPQQPQQSQYTHQPQQRIQYGQYQQQQQQTQQPLPTAPQQQQQSSVQVKPQQVLPVPAQAASVDSRPVNFEKYVDPGKGTPLAPPPQAQCPRQPGWQPCITKETANDRFRNCCSRLGEGCTPLCNYDATLATMQLAVLTGRCPLAKVGDVMICASGYEDASQCCEAYGVFEPGYEHCRPYCNPSAGLPEGGLLTEKYKCLVKLQNIQQCFFVSQKP